MGYHGLGRAVLGRATIHEGAFTLGLSLLFPLIRWVLDVTVLQPVARRLLLPTRVRAGGPVPLKLQSKVSKLAESLWKLVMYIGLVCWGLRCALQEPWFQNTRHYWTDWPDQPLSPQLRLLFGVQLAFYISGVVMLATWELRRKDFSVMMFHHLTTVVLITCTYTQNYARPGCITMLLHDINDVLMEAAKSFKYCRNEAAATGTFAVFTLSWAVLRLYLFPFYVIRSTLFESKQIIGYVPPYYYTINAGLIMLVCIHVYWFHLILQIVYDTLKTGNVDDVREQASDDEHMQ